jgi:DNA-binding response OmpR family regulator
MPDQRQRVFLVEDNLEISRMYERAFRLHGHEIEIAYDGESALKQLEGSETIPDAIIMDVMIPHMNGADLLQKLRSNPRFSGVSIAILTNSFHKEDADHFLELGADLYLVKIEHQSKHVVAQIEALIHKHKSIDHE